MSDAVRTLVSIVPEATFNTVPTTPAWEPLRIVSSSLTFTPKTETSKELRADRQVTDLIRTGFEAGGSLPMEVSYLAMDTLLSGAFMSAWTTRWPAFINNASATPVSAMDGSGQAITVVAGGTALVVGDLVRVTGFANVVNNGIFNVVATVTGTSIPITGATVVTETAPAGVRVKKIGVQFAATALSIAGSAKTLTRVSGSWVSDGLVAGEWVKIGGLTSGAKFGTAVNNGWARIQSVTALVLTFDIVPTGFADDAGTGKTIQLFYGEYIRNGTTPQSFTIEQQFQDLVTPEYHLYTGMRVATMTFTAGQQAILNATTAFFGANASEGTTRTAGSTDKPVPTFDVLNTSSNVGRIANNGVAVTGPNFVMSTEISIDNTLRRQNAVGTVGAIGIGIGRCMVKGKLGTYYGDDTLLAQLRNNQATSYDVRFTNLDTTKNVGEAMIIDCPRVKFESGDPTVPGIDTDRMLDLGFQALRHPTLGYTIQAMKFEGISTL